MLKFIRIDKNALDKYALNFAYSRHTLVYLYSKDNHVDKKALFEIVRMVWLLDDHWDHQHWSYSVSVEQRVIIKLVDIMNFMFISNTNAPYVIL